MTPYDRHPQVSQLGLTVKINWRADSAGSTSERDKGRMTIIDRPITDYVNGKSKHAGIIISRPFDLPPSNQ